MEAAAAAAAAELADIEESGGRWTLVERGCNVIVPVSWEEEGREGGAGRVRALFERLLERTKHVKVWMSYALYEGGRGGGMEGARAVFQRGYAHLK